MRGGIGGRGLVMVLAVVAFLAAAVPAQATLTLTPAFTGSISQDTPPMYVTAPRGDSHRLFIVTRPGVIDVAVDGVLQPTPFLDIRDRVWSDQGEAGMASMAFDPGYQNPASPGYGLFYVYFVAQPTPTEADGAIHIEEFSADPAHTPNVANPAGRVVLTIPHNETPFHYGGTMQFSPNDGLLYIATGDGGDVYDQSGNPQDTKVLLGKLLRIDPHKAGSDPYSIPSGNPFHTDPRCDGSPGTTDCPEILAWGLPNPFRWSFDRANGDIAIGDVGQDDWEEVDYVPASATLARANFGWPCYEGPATTYLGCTLHPHVDPVLSYSHGDHSVPVAITGGVVVRDPALGSLVGRYLYADVFEGVIYSAQLAGPSAIDDRVEPDLPKVPLLVSFGEDADAHVYVVSLDG